MLLEQGIIFIIVFMAVDDHICLGQESATRYFGEGYVHTPGIGAHKLHVTPKDWDAARKTCIREGGHLAILNSKREAEVLTAYYNKEYGRIQGSKNQDSVWLGYHNFFDQNTWNDWVTVLGDPIESTGFADPWNKGPSCHGRQPQSPDTTHCGSLFRNCGTMDDAGCGSAYGFYCEKPENPQKRVVPEDLGPGGIDSAQ